MIHEWHGMYAWEVWGIVLQVGKYVDMVGFCLCCERYTSG